MRIRHTGKKISYDADKITSVKVLKSTGMVEGEYTEEYQVMVFLGGDNFTLDREDSLEAATIAKKEFIANVWMNSGVGDA